MYLNLWIIVRYLLYHLIVLVEFLLTMGLCVALIRSSFRTELSWLPDILPDTCRVVFTTRRSDLSFKSLSTRQDTKIICMPIPSDDDQITIVKRALSQRRKYTKYDFLFCLVMLWDDQKQVSDMQDVCIKIEYRGSDCEQSRYYKIVTAVTSTQCCQRPATAATFAWDCAPRRKDATYPSYLHANFF